jgi:hypothetical protein
MDLEKEFSQLVNREVDIVEEIEESKEYINSKRGFA